MRLSSATTTSFASRSCTMLIKRKSTNHFSNDVPLAISIVCFLCPLSSGKAFNDSISNVLCDYRQYHTRLACQQTSIFMYDPRLKGKP